MEIILFLFGGNSFIEKVFFVETSLKQQDSVPMSFFCKSSDLVTAVDTKSFCLCEFMNLTLSQAPSVKLAYYQ